MERLWGGVRARIGRPVWRRTLPVAASIALAAFVALALRGRTEDPEQTPSATAAMASAERAYARAIDELEAQVAARQRQTGRHEPALGRARTGLARARASAAGDPAARVRMLEGSAAYLKSLRRALQEEAP